VTFNEVPELQFLVAVGGLAFVYNMLAFHDALWWLYHKCAPRDRNFHRAQEEGARVNELFQQMRITIDAALFVLALAAGISTGFRCRRKYQMTVWIESSTRTDESIDGMCAADEQNMDAAVAAILVLSAFSLLMVGLGWARWREMYIAQAEAYTAEMLEMRRKGKSGHAEPAHAEEKDGEEEIDEAKIERAYTARSAAIQQESRALFKTSSTLEKIVTTLLRLLEIAAALVALYYMANFQLTFRRPKFSSNREFYTEAPFSFNVAVAALALVNAFTNLLLQLYKALRKPDKTVVNSFDSVTRPFRCLLDFVFVVLCGAAGVGTIVHCRGRTTGFNPNSEVIENTPEFAFSPTSSAKICVDTPEYDYSGIANLVLAGLFFFSSLFSFSSWLRTRMGESKLRFKRMHRQSGALSLVANADGPMAHADFEQVVRVVTLSNIQGLTENDFKDAVDRKLAVRLFTLRIFLLLAALVNIIGLAARNIKYVSDSGNTLFEFEFYELHDFQFVMAASAFIFFYGLMWNILSLFGRFRRSEQLRFKPEKTVAPFEVFSSFAVLVLAVASTIAAGSRCLQNESIDQNVSHSLCEDYGNSAGARASVIGSLVASFAAAALLYTSWRRWLRYRAQEEVWWVREAVASLQNRGTAVAPSSSVENMS
jgi:hypothetical protein